MITKPKFSNCPNVFKLDCFGWKICTESIKIGKIFYWPFQGGTSFVDLLCFCSVLCLLCLCARLFICALWSPAGKGLTSWLSFVVSTVSLSLSHWYPGSGVVLDCIDSWSLHTYLLSKRSIIYKAVKTCAFYSHPSFYVFRLGVV